jgi:hypothetical protein
MRNGFYYVPQSEFSVVCPFSASEDAAIVTVCFVNYFVHACLNARVKRACR